MNQAPAHELSTTEDEPVAFTLAGAMRGARRALPVALGVFTVGLVFGVLAREARLSLLETMLMSALVFAGASQFVALSLWMLTPFPVITIILTTLVVNLRHVLMSASLRPWFSRLPRFAAYGTLFVMVDESWALTMGEYAAGKRDAAFLLGSGGLLLMSFITPSPRVEAWLRQIPGAVLISIIAPAIFLTSLAQTLAALVTLLAAIYTKNLLVAIIAGVAAVSLLRLAL